MDMSYADGDRISKLIETGPKVTLQSSYKSCLLYTSVSVLPK